MNSDRLANLAAVRGETRQQTQAYLVRLAEKLVPSNLPDLGRILSVPVAETGMEGAYAFVRLHDNTIFYGYPTSATRLRQYWVLRDKLPRTVAPPAFGTLFDVERRYFRADVDELDAPEGAVIIEGGAYTGFKAMRYAHAAGPTGRVIAVEIDAANEALMRRNIEANGLEDRISTVCAGLWSVPGRLPSQAGNYQRHSLAGIDSLAGARSREVECTTIDDIVASHGLARVDFLNVQVNGAELEVLRGAKQSAPLIRQVGLNTKYKIAGEVVRDEVVAWLEEHGFDVSYRTENRRRVIARRTVPAA